ncbi:hypothetical protein MKX03_037132, partial [Papaver bracteatum]
MAIFSSFSGSIRTLVCFISFMFYLVIDIFHLISDLSLDFDLPYRRRVTHSDRGHLTTPSLQASSSAANMTKKILPVMKLEDLPDIFNCTDHTCAICLS